MNVPVVYLSVGRGALSAPYVCYHCCRLYRLCKEGMVTGTIALSRRVLALRTRVRYSYCVLTWRTHVAYTRNVLTLGTHVAYSRCVLTHCALPLRTHAVYSHCVLTRCTQTEFVWFIRICSKYQFIVCWFFPWRELVINWNKDVCGLTLRDLVLMPWPRSNAVSIEKISVDV